MCYLVFIKINIFCSTSETRVEWINAMVLHYCDVGILLVLSEWIERYLEYSYPFIVLCWIGVTQKIENFFHLHQNPHSSIQTIEPRREIKMAQRSDKTRWESNSFYDLSHPPDICRADGWWDWMSDEGRGLVDPQFHICAFADLWEYSLVYCECDMTVIQIPNRDEGCLTSDVSRRGKRGRNCDAGRGTWSPVSSLEGAADLICWSPPRTPGGHGAADVSTLDVLLTPTT